MFSYHFKEKFHHFDITKIVTRKCFNLDLSKNYLCGKELRPFTKGFQIYRSGQCSCPCFPGVLLTSVPHNILFKPLSTFQITIVQKLDSGERGMNHVAMTIFNPQTEYCQSRRSNQRHTILKSCAVPTEPWGSKETIKKPCLIVYSKYHPRWRGRPGDMRSLRHLPEVCYGSCAVTLKLCQFKQGAIVPSCQVFYPFPNNPWFLSDQKFLLFPGCFSPI